MLRASRKSVGISIGNTAAARGNQAVSAEFIRDWLNPRTDFELFERP
jgi:hypothetical protein